MNHNQTHLQPLPEPMDHLLTTHLFSTSFNPSSSVAFQPPPSPPPAPAKRKRSLPGHPDPESEVVALSPNSLLATNRFMCEICNKGFQRDQNLQLHRRGHNLPWKLKQRAKDEMVKKKVYVCPELGCVHHDPARALGDLTGIKKHFYRKHGEKKWKCEKCSKKYAVHSDWKAHSKTCGTKEYKCDCGALFSRRDSFITHKAFCDALVDDTARAITSNPFLPPPPPAAQQQATAHDCHNQPQAATSAPTPDIPNLLPTWLQPPGLLFSPPQNPSHVDIGGPSSPYPPAQPHMSATALLQKAAQLGAIMSTNNNTIPFPPFFTAAGAGTVSSGSGGSDAGSLLLHEMMMMKSMPTFDGSDHIINAFGTNGGISDGLTRDFLGLSPLISHADHIVNLTVTGLTDHHANAAAAATASSSQEIV